MWSFVILCTIFFSIQNNYYTFHAVILHLINLYNYVCVCVLYCGGHHDSDRMAVLVWSSRLEIIVFVNTTNLCILCQILISFLPSFHAKPHTTTRNILVAQGQSPGQMWCGKRSRSGLCWYWSMSLLNICPLNGRSREGGQGRSSSDSEKDINLSKVSIIIYVYCDMCLYLIRLTKRS